MQFKQIIGHTALKRQLCSSVDTARIPHAQLFLGPEGSGQLALALAFAQYVLCENPSDGDSCGQCSACNKATKFIHPDVHFSFPTVGSKAISNHFLENWRTALKDNPYLNANEWLQHIGAENKQGNITKEECVSIVKKLSLKSFEAVHKILILWLPEYLAKEGNRLLKLIEEPPENTLFVLVAENQELILNTIISRCQILKVHALPDNEIIEGLMHQKGLSETEAQKAAHLSDGNYNAALQVARHQENDNARLFLEWLRKCYQGHGVEQVSWAEKLAGLGRENQKHFLHYALHFLREFLRLKLIGEEGVRLQQEELNTAMKMLKVIDVDQVEQIVKLFDDCTYYIERNANPKILFLDAAIQINSILKRVAKVG